MTAKKRILLVNPLPSLSLYSWPEVGDITGHPAYIMNIAPPTLAAMTPPEVEVTIVDEAVEPVSFDGDWDLVGITGYLTQMRRMCEIADEFRRRGRLVAIGGPYASLSPHVVRPHADILFIGEAEATWPAFLEDFLSGHWQAEYRSTELVDVQTSPVPALSTLRPGAYELGVVQTSRGCPFECEFCDVIIYLGRKQRHKTPSRVVDELEQMYAAGYRSIFLSDDNFTANRQRAAETMRAVRDWNRSQPEPVALYTQLSIDVTRDADLPLLDLCAEAGLKQAFVGIETPECGRPARSQEAPEPALGPGRRRPPHSEPRDHGPGGHDHRLRLGHAGDVWPPVRVSSGGRHPDGPAGDAERARRHAAAASPGQ